VNVARLSMAGIRNPAHEQNAFHAGFLPIIRVAAELWSRLIKKGIPRARDILRWWGSSDFRLVHRLALYAATDPRISPGEAATVLIALPKGELFLTNSQVEVHRLVRERWTEFPAKHRGLIEKRIVEGPPSDWFHEGAELGRITDRCRFELLLDLERSKLPLGNEAALLLEAIRERHPNWRGGEPKKVGFVMWQGSLTEVVGNKEKLASVPDEKLIEAARTAAGEADFMDGSSWQTLCQDEPSRAFRGIENALPAERWHQWAWNPFLWAATKITDPDELNRIASLLAQWPESMPFDETSSGAAWWMDEVSEKIKAPLLWAVWDLIEQRAPRRTEVLNDDPFGTALNDAAGHLASVLLKRTKVPKGRRERKRRRSV
jgi:hypothetical protein